MALSWTLRKFLSQTPQIAQSCTVAQQSGAAIYMAHVCRVQCDWHSQGGQLDEQKRNAGRAGHHSDKALGHRHHHGGCNEAHSQRPMDHRFAVLTHNSHSAVHECAAKFLEEDSDHNADDFSICSSMTYASAMRPICLLSHAYHLHALSYCQ